MNAHEEIDLNFFANNDCKLFQNKLQEVIYEKFVSETFRVTPLMIAVAVGNVKMVYLLLKNKSMDINAKDPDSGINAVWLACLYG